MIKNFYIVHSIGWMMFRNTAAIGSDIGRVSINLAVVRYSGEILETLRIPLDDKQQTKAYVTSRLLEGIRQIRIMAAEKNINPISIGISAKGFIDHKNGVILGPGQGIRGWKQVPLASIISTETALPVFVGNDANLMTIAEHRFGAARDFNDVIFVALRTGIGGGIIIDGKLYRGVNNSGGEFGQMIINCDGTLSENGIRGSFEHLASASALVRRYEELSGKKGSAKETSTGCKDVFELSYRKDQTALQAVSENAELVGIGLANLISIFSPEIILLGGGMSEAADSYIRLIKKSAFANSLENCRSEVKIERALLGSSASMIGAAYYSLSRLAGKSVW
jgi:glucokinase